MVKSEVERSEAQEGLVYHRWMPHSPTQVVIRASVFEQMPITKRPHLGGLFGPTLSREGILCTKQLPHLPHQEQPQVLTMLLGAERAKLKGRTTHTPL